MGIESSDQESTGSGESSEASPVSPSNSAGESPEHTPALSRSTRWIENQAIQHAPRFIRNRIFGRQFNRAHLKNLQASDARKNKKTRIPDGESVGLDTIWICETYGPDSSDKLNKFVRRMEKSDSESSSPPGYSDWLLESRSTGVTGFLQLPRVVRRSGQFIEEAPHVTMTLPPGIEYIDLHLHSITSSITAIVACFVLESDESKIISTAVNEDQESKLIIRKNHRKRSSSPADVIKLKIGAQSTWREQKRLDCSSWMNENLPGWFSRDADVVLPSVELITTQKCLAWDKEEVRNPSDYEYTEILGLGGGRIFWKSQGSNEIRLRETSERVITAAARIPDLTMQYTDSSQYISAFTDSISELLTRWSLLIMVRITGEQLTVLRDRSERAVRKGTGRSFTSLRKSLLQAGVDTQIVIGDISAMANDSKDWATIGFSPVVPPRLATYGAIHALPEGWRQEALLRSQEALQFESRLRELISTSAELTATATNIRIQKVVIWLTTASVIAAAIAAWASVAALHKH
ncbi:hypothetical protein [Streptacidiphilus albus]|uniref:hypothetical protein n=1 Tax=Streptacidiphilus albus TaxID=105425 RepID=UPI00128C4456|nr:hypothetical protein [Streptacidiphilus albus]